VDGAPWCTLCYTNLRAPAVAPASVAEVTIPQPSGVHAAPSAPPSSAATSLDLLDPQLDLPVATAAAARRGPATWPCATCGASVDLDQDACAECGSPFLAGVDPAPALAIPLVGPIRPLAVSKSSKIWLVVGGAFAVCVLLMVMLSLVGMLL